MHSLQRCNRSSAGVNTRFGTQLPGHPFFKERVIWVLSAEQQLVLRGGGVEVMLDILPLPQHWGLCWTGWKHLEVGAVFLVCRCAPSGIKTSSFMCEKQKNYCSICNSNKEGYSSSVLGLGESQHCRSISLASGLEKCHQLPSNWHLFISFSGLMVFTSPLFPW